jgi:phenylacetate-CoA ligase
VNKWAENIYFKSPVCLQNVMCSVYGAKLYMERYSNPWKKHFEYLMRTQFMSDEELKKIQIDSFKSILSHAVENVPYYQKNVRLEKPEIEVISSMDILRELPILEKRILRETPEVLMSKFYDRRKLVRINTSGTTGTPLTIYISPDARRENYAFFERSKQWAGINGFERSITFAGRTIVPAEQEGPPYWRRNLLFNNTIFSSYHLSKNTVEDYLKAIRKIKPVFIDSYPSSISIIADHVIRSNGEAIKVKAIITSAETLFDHQRRKIEKAFGCKVYDQYGSAEQVVFVCQCEEGSYHINPEYGYLEVLDGNNQPAKTGELGEFVCTGFTNTAMPLIRYRIGDMGIMSEKKCGCGRHFPVVERIEGRDDDVLITPDGRYIGRLDPIFKGVENTIKESQIIQEKIDLVRILIVRSEGYQEKHGEFIVSELEKRMGTALAHKIEYVDSVPRAKNGKYRAVICEVNKEQPVS